MVVQQGHASLIGATLGGYEVEALIGRGAMGSVYLARDQKLDRQVALKVLLGSLAKSSATVKQFHQEAQAAAPLRHEGIVRVYSAGVENGIPYIVMEFVDGEPLDRFLRRKGKIKWQVAFHVAGKIALALDCAHRSGIVHRDVKPSNVMLDRKGGIRLTDFGIANIHGEGSDDSTTPEIIGTPQFMSPEQCTGHGVGPASDLYGLGVTLYLMISGEMPFHGESYMALIKNICTEQAKRLDKLDPDIPDDVARLVAYLLEKKPEKRPANGRVVNALMNRLQQQRGGVSALPAALSAFIESETAPRPFSKLNRYVSSSDKDSKLKSSRTRKMSGMGMLRAARVGVIGVLACLAFAVGPISSQFARHGETRPAPTLDFASFRDLSSSVTLAHLSADGFRFGDITWVADRDIAIVNAKGFDGTLTQGASGLLAVDISRREIVSLQAPTGPAMGTVRRRSHLTAVVPSVLPPMPPNSPFYESFPVNISAPGSTRVTTLAQRYTEAVPRPAVLYRGALATEQKTQPVPVAVSPDGVTVALVVPDDVTGALYLVERNVHVKPVNAVGTRRTSIGRIIRARSVQYSPDGQWLCYLSSTGTRSSELRLLKSGGSEVDGTLLATQVAGDHISFGPHGRQIVIASRFESDGSPELKVIDIETGRVQASLGPGILSAQSWHVSGDYLVVASEYQTSEARRDTSVLQLWAIGVRAPHRRVRLTGLKEGVLPSYAVSRDGRWVAAVAHNDVVPTLALVDLTVANLDGLA